MSRCTESRSRRTEPEGVLLVDKPVGYTSHRVVSRIRRMAGIRRVGHCGTLDPMASGLLVLCLGRATRLARFTLDMPKTYTGVMRLGVTTDTQDRCGRVINRRAVTDTARDRLYEVANEFTGHIYQVPPMYSAVKQQGVPLYQLARKGLTVERKPRSVVIDELRFGPVRRNEVAFQTKCSSGTYVRTLCHDIGEKLGCGAVLSELRRLNVGHFSIDDAVRLDQMTSGVDLMDRVRPAADIVRFLPSTLVNPATAATVANGRPVPASCETCQWPEGTWIRIERENGRLLAVGQVRPTKEQEPSLCVWPRIVMENRVCAS